MAQPKESMYKIENGKPIPSKAEEMAWTLRYGSEEDIINHRLYIAHIVSLYIQSRKD